MTRAKTAYTKTIRGDWMDNGYLRTFGPRHLEILVIDGVAHDKDGYDLTPASHRHESRLTIDADDSLIGWGASTSFAPDAGELDRVGRDLFSA